MADAGDARRINEYLDPRTLDDQRKRRGKWENIFLEIANRLGRDSEFTELYIWRFIATLKMVCNNWESCADAFMLVFDPFQVSTHVSSAQYLENNPNIRNALRFKIGQLGYPRTDKDFEKFKYCLAIIGIQTDKAEKKPIEKVERVGVWPFRHDRFIKKEIWTSVPKTKEEILREIG